MIKINSEIKDYLIAREMFGSNTKEQCKLVSKLKEKGVITPHCDGWSIITLPSLVDDCGWLIPNNVLIIE